MKTYIAEFEVYGRDQLIMKSIDANDIKEAEKEARSWNRLNGYPYRFLRVNRALMTESEDD